MIIKSEQILLLAITVALMVAVSLPPHIQETLLWAVISCTGASVLVPAFLACVAHWPRKKGPLSAITCRCGAAAPCRWDTIEIRIRYWDGTRYRTMVGHVGEEGLKEL